MTLPFRPSDASNVAPAQGNNMRGGEAGRAGQCPPRDGFSFPCPDAATGGANPQANEVADGRANRTESIDGADQAGRGPDGYVCKSERAVSSICSAVSCMARNIVSDRASSASPLLASMTGATAVITKRSGSALSRAARASNVMSTCLAAAAWPAVRAASKAVSSGVIKGISFSIGGCAWPMVSGGAVSCKSRRPIVRKEVAHG